MALISAVCSNDKQKPAGRVVDVESFLEESTGDERPDRGWDAWFRSRAVVVFWRQLANFNLDWIAALYILNVNMVVVDLVL